MSTVSPDGVRRVELSVVKPGALFLIADSVVIFDAYENNNLTVVEASLARYDWTEAPFSSQFPSTRWINNHALEFLHPAENERGLSVLTVQNIGMVDISYLIIDAGSKLIVFDVPARQSKSFNVPHQKWQTWISAQAHFSGGIRNLRNSADFVHKDNMGTALRFCVSINEEEIQISSPDVQGWRHGEATIPVGRSCDAAGY